MYAAISPCFVLNNEITYENYLQVRKNHHCMVALTMIAAIAAIVFCGACCLYNQAVTTTPLQNAIGVSLCALFIIFMGLAGGYANTSRIMYEKLIEEESNLSDSTKV